MSALIEVFGDCNFPKRQLDNKLSNPLAKKKVSNPFVGMVVSYTIQISRNARHCQQSSRLQGIFSHQEGEQEIPSCNQPR